MGIPKGSPCLPAALQLPTLVSMQLIFTLIGVALVQAAPSILSRSIPTQGSNNVPSSGSNSISADIKNHPLLLLTLTSALGITHAVIHQFASPLTVPQSSGSSSQQSPPISSTPAPDSADHPSNPPPNNPPASPKHKFFGSHSPAVKSSEVFRGDSYELNWKYIVTSAQAKGLNFDEIKPLEDYFDKNPQAVYTPNKQLVDQLVADSKIISHTKQSWVEAFVKALGEAKGISVEL